MKKTLILCLLIFSTQSMAESYFVNGSKFYILLKEDVTNRGETKLGLFYLMGIVDAMNGTFFCLPENRSTALDPAELVIKSMEMVPATWEKQPAWSFVVVALKNIYPCKNQDSMK